ncbi:hypothetical protein BDV95DRAFT_558239 [Massariosphaeria phaeospora]|uniref:F-box domain-containing protein n=1 Tax=Massariosphaeria phaeospora TaxID=100035 RepID=A0A7C8MI88_9PLEO|nr:hypothetical protein BDV95DRAFT_558239 [Massariosphaeria phaeospora]
MRLTARQWASLRYKRRRAARKLLDQQRKMHQDPVLEDNTLPPMHQLELPFRLERPAFEDCNSDRPAKIHQNELTLRLKNNPSSKLQLPEENLDKKRSTDKKASNPPGPPAQFHDLSTELHVEIIRHLPYTGALQLSMTNHYFQTLVKNEYSMPGMRVRAIEDVVDAAIALNKKYEGVQAEYSADTGRGLGYPPGARYRACYRCLKVKHRSYFGGIPHHRHRSRAVGVDFALLGGSRKKKNHIHSTKFVDLCLECDAPNFDPRQWQRKEAGTLRSGRRIRICPACGCVVSQWSLDERNTVWCPCLKPTDDQKHRMFSHECRVTNENCAEAGVSHYTELPVYFWGFVSDAEWEELAF